MNLIIQVGKKMESIVAQPKIHFYEFMQIEILNDYILTGIEYMVKSILNSRDTFIRFRYFSEDIAALLSGLKDIYFLIRHKSVYAQYFYGLQRANKRSKLVILYEIVLWIVLPYLCRKLQSKYNRLKQKVEEGVNLGFLGGLYTKIFPFLYCIAKIVSTIIKFKYLIDKNKYYFGKTQLSYQQEQKSSPFPIMSFMKSPGLFVILVAHKIASFVFSGEKKQKGKIQAKQVEAPLSQKKQKICPICGKDFKNAAVLKTSGYVFCYNCISRQIKKEGKCPVTGIEAEEQQIQILYD